MCLPCSFCSFKRSCCFVIVRREPAMERESTLRQSHCLKLYATPKPSPKSRFPVRYRVTRASGFYPVVRKAGINIPCRRRHIVRVLGGDTECPLQVCRLSKSSESTYFLSPRRDVALLGSTRALDDFWEQRHVPPF